MSRLSKRCLRPALLAGFLLLCPAAAIAQEPPICTDRPAKANAVCTVPSGKVQLETAVAGWSLTRLKGSRAAQLTVGSTVVKVGLSDRSDLQVGFAPYALLKVGREGLRDRVSGFGDVVVRYKRRLTRDGGKVQVAAIPFVKLPTAAHGLGNDRAEGGLAVPVSLPLAAATITLGPEIDLLADSDGRGRHLAAINLVNVAVPVGKRFTVAGELWTSFNFDPSGTLKQASADAAVAYSLSRRVQIDVGTNLGLNGRTPDFEIYAGTSLRF
jgi:hypothetical protein